VLIQEEAPLDKLQEIGFYVTSSDGDGSPKTNEKADLVAQTAFAPDRDATCVCALPACHWPYVLTPCTFKPGVTGKFQLYLLTDHDNLQHVEFAAKNIVINAEDVQGAGESTELRELKRRYKSLGPAVVDSVKITEQLDKGVPEFMQWIGRQLLQTAAQFQDGLSAWTNGEEPAFWTEYYAEEDVEEVAAAPAGGAPGPPPPPPPPSAGGPPPPPPPKKGPVINFSKPVKAGMVNTDRTSSMTDEHISALENKAQTLLFVDEMLSEIKGGLSKLKKVTAPPPKPKVEDPLVCAFNLSVLTQRRAAIEGLNDKPDDDWDDDNWDE